MASLMEITQLCRLCLVKDQVNIPIFEEPGDIRQIFLKISACLPVKVAREDNLPKKICDGCSYKLEMFYEFWNTSASSEKQLLKWLEQVGIDKLPTSSDKSAQPQSHSINTDGVVLKQEVLDLGETHGDDDELPTDDLNVPTDPEYLLQQQSYQSFEFQTDGFNEGETASAAGPSSTITSGAAASAAPKRKRRAAAMKPLPPQNDSEDEDDTGLIEPKIAKTEEQSDDSAGEDHEPTTFVGLPDDNEQPGPSGVGKAATSSDAPPTIYHQELNNETLRVTNHFEYVIKTETPYSESMRTVEMEEKEFCFQLNNSNITERVLVPRVTVTSLSIQQANNSLVTSSTTEIPGSRVVTSIPLMAGGSSDPSKIQTFDARTVSKAPALIQKMTGCNFCGALFTGKDLVQQHQKNFHKKLLHEKKLKMPTKAKTKIKKLSRSRQKELQILMETTTSDDGRFWYKCKACLGLFQYEKPTLRHIDELHYERVTKAPNQPDVVCPDVVCKCLACGKVCKSLSSLNQHLSAAHPADFGKWKCKECNQTFAIKSLFESHIVKYPYDHFKCPYCRRIFGNETPRKVHIQTCENNALFENTCKICCKQFSFARDLSIHQKQMHRNSCRRCVLEFPTRKALKKHLLSVGHKQRKSAQSNCNEQDSNASNSNCFI